MKVVVLTTSYPAPDHPVAGNFVASSVEAARAAGELSEEEFAQREGELIERALGGG